MALNTPSRLTSGRSAHLVCRVDPQVWKGSVTNANRWPWCSRNHRHIDSHHAFCWTAGGANHWFSPLVQQAPEVRYRNEEVRFLRLFDPIRSHGLSILRQRLRLIKLLVNGIISLLRALISPVKSKARDVVRSMACLSDSFNSW